MREENQKSPFPLIGMVVGAVVLVVVAIYFLAKLATSGFDVNAEVMTKEAVAARLKPVGESVAGDPPGSRTGEGIYKTVCASCHDAGLAGSPKFADAGAWSGRIAQGYDTLVKHATLGFNAMPARGGAADLTDDEVKRAVAFMANAAGAKFEAPAVGSASGEAAGAVADPMVAGKKLYETVCATCHAAGVAGAPKFDDKAAWQAREKAAGGLDALVQSGIKGKNAMPPKGGFAGADAEFKAAVQYMVQH